MLTNMQNQVQYQQPQTEYHLQVEYGIEERIKTMTIKQKVGQLMVVGFQKPELSKEDVEHLQTHSFGNFIYFKHNIANKEQILALSQRLREIGGEDAFICIDQEGGMVTRIFNGATFFPGAMAVAQSGDPENARKVGEIMGEELLSLGINFNLAPVLDINSNPNNPVIGVRSFGDSKETVTAFGTRYIEGLQSKGVLATAKHFPGHGDTASDSHYTLPLINHPLDRLLDFELVPFKAAIDGGIGAVMTSHILFKTVDEERPATLSEKVLTGLLRKRLGFEGLIITDDMEMKAIADTVGSAEGVLLAIQAGADLVCVSHTRSTQKLAYERLMKAVTNGELSEERIDQSLRRILKAKAQFKVSEYDTVTQEDYAKHQAFSKELSQKSIRLLRGSLDHLQAGKTLFISSSPISLNDADGVLEESKALLPGHCDYLTVKDSSSSQSQEIVKKAAAYDNVLFLSYNASMFPSQVQLVQDLYKQNNKLVVIASRNPNDILLFEEVQNYVATYEYTKQAMEALTAFLAPYMPEVQ